jgi:hypothetical protein
MSALPLAKSTFDPCNQPVGGNNVDDTSPGMMFLKCHSHEQRRNGSGDGRAAISILECHFGVVRVADA